MKFNNEDLKDSVAEFVIYVGSHSYDQVMNMPFSEKNRLIKMYNKKIKKESQK